MRILKNIFLFLFLATASVSYAQLTISTEGGEAAMGTNLEVDITANEFNSLSTFQFNVVWDTLVMTFVEVKNVNEDLTSYSLVTNFGLPGDGSIKDGTVSTSWTKFTPPAESLADDARLFTIVLNATGAECATSSFGFENEEAGDENFEEVTVTSTGGDILVSGTDCESGELDCINECEDFPGVILSMPCLTAPAGSSICIPITVYNFIDIEAVQAGIIWDPSVMEYTGFQNLGFVIDPPNDPNSGFVFNDNDAEMGMIRQFWTDETGSTPQSLPDSSVLYELCFDVIGDDGDMISIEFGNIGNFGVEVVQLGAGVEFCLDQGTVTIGDIVGDGVQLIANDVSGLEGEVVCVDITVRGFTDVTGYQANLQWDNTIVEYSSVEMLNTTLGLTTSNFNFTTDPDNLSFTWDNINPATLDDDAILFQACFTVVGDCETTPTSVVTFESTDISDIEFSDPVGMAIPFTVSNGSVSVLPCIHTCSLVEVSQPLCPGGDGSIIVIVEADDTCDCNWYLNGESTPIQTTPGDANCNLNAVGAGSYTFELTDASGAVVCMFDQAIIDPASIATNPSITNAASCEDTGSITINATGGTGTLTYTWVPDVSTTDSATELPAGDYMITIFDENDCLATVMLTVATDPLIFDATNSTVTNPICNGSNDGSISGAAIGGCPPYMFDYEGGGDGTGLAAGDYGVTVTDTNGNTAEGSVSLTDPEEITFTVSVSNESNGMMDGSITITPNGTAPYSYLWNPDVSNTIVDDTNVATGLSAGLYDVTVTDSKGCSVSQLGIEVNNIITIPLIGTVTTTNVDGCFGDCTGVIASSVLSLTEGTLTIVLSGPSNSTQTLDSSGPFSFDGLCAGIYSIAVTDVNNATDIQVDIEINEPSDLDATVSTGDDNNNCDGFIDVVASGGTGFYTYQWVNQDWDTPSVSNLCAGFYDLVITDDNGCVFMLIDIEVGGGFDVPCWVPRKIITPNNDGKNDFFTFNCINNRVAGLYIFDRYGREVYSNADYDNSFNGVSDSGVVLSEGGYMWVLNINDGAEGRRVEQGTLTLLRD